MEDKDLSISKDKTKIVCRVQYVVLNLFRVGSLVESGRVVHVVHGLAETPFFALRVRSGYIKDVAE